MFGNCYRIYTRNNEDLTRGHLFYVFIGRLSINNPKPLTMPLIVCFAMPLIAAERIGRGHPSVIPVRDFPAR